MAYDPAEFISRYDRVGFSRLDEPLAVFISFRTGKKYGLNETDIYEAYLELYEHHQAMRRGFKVGLSLQMNEFEKARAALQEMKRQYGVALDTPPCIRPIESNTFHFPAPLSALP